MDFHSTSSLNQQSSGRYFAPLKDITLIPSQLIFVLTPLYCVLSVEATNTSFIDFSLTWLELEPTIYRTRIENV